MTGRTIRIAGLTLALLMPAAATPRHAGAQVGAPLPALANASGGTAGVPVPSQGDWAWVITVKEKWLVLENALGQQFPVNVDHIRTFLIRWPTTLEELAPGTLAEVNGLDLGSNQIGTNHMDVFEGQAAAALGVAPGFMTQGNLGFANNNFQIQTNLQFNLFQPMMGVGSGLLLDGTAGWVHCVGPLLAISPIRVGIPANNFANVVPQTDDFSVTSVTPGSPSLMRRGDRVYFIPSEVTPKSLDLNQLIVYKTVPMRAFGR